MSLNETNPHIVGAHAAGAYPAVANPTASTVDPIGANFINDPATDQRSAGAGPNFEAGRRARHMSRQTAGVIEGRPGIIETTNIDPLDHESGQDDRWAHATATPQGSIGGMSGMLSSAAGMAKGAAQKAYGAVTGDQAAKKAGKEAT